MNDTAKLLMIVVLASFATERVLAATTYVLDGIRITRGKPRRVKRSLKRQFRKLLLMAIAGAIAAVVVQRGDIRVLKILGLTAPLALDYGLSWLIVLGGADKLRALLGASGAQPSKSTTAVNVTVDGEGKVTKLLRAS